MELSSLHFAPVALPFLLVFFLLGGLLIALIEIGILEYAYAKIGIDQRYFFSFLLLSLLGSYVNIPVAELPAERLYSGREVVYFGMRYVIPAFEGWSRTIIAVNLGGAVVPTCLSLYLVAKNQLYKPALLGTVIVSVAVHSMAEPVRGLGIAVPVFIPPVVAVLTALLLSRRSAPALAYICGSLGALIGADVLNLGKIAGLGAPVASIGGAGTFDGIFVTGILAALLA